MNRSDISTRRPNITQRYRDIPHTRHRNCRICGTNLGQAVIDLPDFPLTEIYVPKPPTARLARLDQAVCLCPRCGHGQLANAIPAEVLYGDNYFTRTTGSASAKAAVDDFLTFAAPHLPTGKVGGILEVGCNDLYLLEKMKPRAAKLCGIDPIWQGREHEGTSGKVRVIGDFFEKADQSRIGFSPDLVFCSHTLEHIDDPVALLRSLVAIASPQTRFFFQFPGLEPLLLDCRFDQLHHQHLNYFTLRSVIAALEQAGAELIDYQFNFSHWGALMIAFKKHTGNRPARHQRFTRSFLPIDPTLIRQRYKTYQTGMSATNSLLGRLLESRKVYGYGAALMLPLLHYQLPALAGLECILDDDPLKQNLYYINYPRPIRPVSSVGSLHGASVVVTAINSKFNVRALTLRLIEAKVQDLILPTPLL